MLIVTPRQSTSAGDGVLKDHALCSTELRSFFAEVPVERLFEYAHRCLDTPFNRSGLVLQDIVNELGRRLEFEVENGLYQGKKDVVGFDGVWRAKNEPELIIEVKTTDSFTVGLEKLAAYKDRLQVDGKVSRNASVLIVVGREDTGALEAQIRGSRYAWDMRLISLDRLIKLVEIMQKSDDLSTLNQIRQLLQPFEYTKIDKIIDVIFTTTVNVETQQEIEQEFPNDDGQDGNSTYKQDRTDPTLLNAKRQQAVEAFAACKGKQLIKRSRTLFWSPDKELRVCCVVSKRYDSEYQPYWYAFHPKWDEFLAEGKESYFVISCMDRDEAFAVPYSWIEENKKNLNMTDRGERSYWHIAITTVGGKALAINTSKIGSKVPLAPYRYSLGHPASKSAKS